ncbi:MAG: ATP-binding protein [Actinomycetota bacterium]
MAATRDANSRAFAELIRLLRARGVDPSALCDGLPIELEALEGFAWLEWEVAAELLARIESLAGGRDEFIALAGDLTNHPVAKRMWAIGRSAVSVELLYRLTVNYMAPSVFPVHTSSFRKIADGEYRIRLELPQDRVGSEPFFWAGYGTYLALPKLLGVDRASVEATIGPHRGDFHVRTEQKARRRSAVLRRIRAVGASEEVVRTLGEQEAELRRSHGDLLAALAELEERKADMLTEIEDHKATRDDLRRRELELRQAQKLEIVGTLAASLAHDFNNILAVIAATLGPRDVAGAVPAEDASRIRDAVDLANAITARLATIGAPRELEPQRLDANRRLEAGRRLFELAAGERRLVWSLGDDAPEIVIDAIEFEQCLLNLIINARDASPPGGAVEVSTRAGTDGEVDGGLVLEVRDEGAGMSAETLERIWDPFYTSGRERGTGLGLGIVRRVVADAGGDIAVVSELGEGSTFRISLPAASDSEVPGSGL